jgi:hypothetical protein
LTSSRVVRIGIGRSIRIGRSIAVTSVLRVVYAVGAGAAALVGTLLAVWILLLKGSHSLGNLTAVL